MKKICMLMIMIVCIPVSCSFARAKSPIKVAVIENVKSGPGNAKYFSKNYFMEKNAQWYKNALTEPEYKATLIQSEQLLDHGILNKTNFDVVIFPYGAIRVPFDIYENKFPVILASYMKNGGHVIFTGMGGGCSPYDKKKKKYLSGEETKKIVLERPYIIGMKFLAVFPTFNVSAIRTMGQNQTTKDTPVLNPLFKNISSDLPQSLKISGSGLWHPYTISLGKSMSAGTGFKDDLIIPLYQIDVKGSRGNPKKAGPVWIVRYHDCRFNNSTLIMTYFRYCNAPIFSRPDGDKILKSLINICLRKQLPGEKAPSYYTKKLTLKSNSVELEKLYVDVIHKITTLQQTALYEGKKDTVESWLKRKSELEATMNDLQNLKWKLLNEESTEKQFANGLKKTNKLIAKLEKISAKLPAEKGKYPPTTFYFSIQGGCPDFAFFLKNLEIAKDTGINSFLGHYGFFIDYLYKTYGTKFYTFLGSGGHHRGPCGIPCAGFAPGTKKNLKDIWKRNWLYDEELYKKIMESANGSLDKLKGKEWLGMLHLPNEMHIRFNQGWGERGMMLFSKYLKKRYNTIDKVNEIWQTNYKDFSEVTVPIKAPKTQKDHAYFDDWTNFRDSIFNRYAKDLYAMAKKKLPEMPVVSRYMGMNVQATRGNNYSVLNEYCDINGSHSYWYGNLYTGDWLHRIGRKPFYNTEYAFHKYNKTGQMNYIKWLCRDLWHGISNGQIGFQFYPWYWTHVPRFESYAFLESDGTPRMVVWELRNFIKKSGIWSDIVKEGKSMEKAQVAFLWSDTSRRHQIDTLISPSPVFKNAEGLNALFRNIHAEREILTEPEIQNGEIPSCTKLIIIPGSVYFEKATYEKLDEFVKKGGWLFVIGDKGAYYDNRGKKDFTFYNIASIVPINIPSPRFLEYNGKTITDFGNLSKWYGWKDIGKKMEVLASTAEDYPVIVKVKKGKGGIILSSYPIGNIYLVLTNCGLITKPFPESAIIFQGIMKDILASLDIQETAEAPPLIEVHPWYYKKGEYLLITNLQLHKEGVFSIKLPYAVKSIYDVINGVKVPLKAEDGKTSFDIYLGKGDGIVLEVKK